MWKNDEENVQQEKINKKIAKLVKIYTMVDNLYKFVMN